MEGASNPVSISELSSDLLKGVPRVGPGQFTKSRAMGHPTICEY